MPTRASFVLNVFIFVLVFFYNNKQNLCNGYNETIISQIIITLKGDHSNNVHVESSSHQTNHLQTLTSTSTTITTTTTTTTTLSHRYYIENVIALNNGDFASGSCGNSIIIWDSVNYRQKKSSK
jgi:hypothetical protein